ncbi:hypothetical protein EBZ39_01445 [bacterium]|nr:hypothetical protein [bacterium]
MDLTDKEAFRLGFLARCAEEGLHGAQLQERIKSAAEKQAIWPVLLGLGGLTLAGQAITGGLSKAIDSTALLAGTVPAAGLALGSGLGYGVARATEPNITDDDIKSQELADTYRIYADRARAKSKARKYRQAKLDGNI